MLTISKETCIGMLFLLGIIGIDITMILNITADTFIHSAATLPEQISWWSGWVISYAVWMTFLFLGLGLMVKNRLCF